MIDKERIIQQIKEFFLKEKGKRILFSYLHGSFLTEDRFNDIDIAVYLEEEALIKSHPVDLEISLSIEMEHEIGLPIDVKILNRAPLGFRYQATSGLSIFSKDELKREDFLCQTWLEYFDFLPKSLMYLKEVCSR